MTNDPCSWSSQTPLKILWNSYDFLGPVASAVERDRPWPPLEIPSPRCLAPHWEELLKGCLHMYIAYNIHTSPYHTTPLPYLTLRYANYVTLIYNPEAEVDWIWDFQRFLFQSILIPSTYSRMKLNVCVTVKQYYVMCVFRICLGVLDEVSIYRGQ